MSYERIDVNTLELNKCTKFLFNYQIGIYITMTLMLFGIIFLNGVVIPDNVLIYKLLMFMAILLIVTLMVLSLYVLLKHKLRMPPPAITMV